jgi:glutamate dehydrogenase
MDIRACWGRIDSLDSKIPATVQYEMLAASTAAVAQATHWLLSFEKGLESIANTLKRLHGPLVEFFNGLLKNADPLSQLRIKHSIQRLQDTGVPGTLAQEIASLNWLTAGLNVVSLAHGSKRPVAVIADTYFKLSHHLSLQTLLDRIDVLKCEHHWAEVARDGLREECQRLHRDLTAMVLMHTKGSQKPSVESVLPTQAPAVTHFKRVMNDIEKQSQADFSILSIAIKNLRSLSSHHSE